MTGNWWIRAGIFGLRETESRMERKGFLLRRNIKQRVMERRGRGEVNAGKNECNDEERRREQ